MMIFRKQLAARRLVAEVVVDGERSRLAARAAAAAGGHRGHAPTGKLHPEC